jgi:hypothetical protein
MQQILHKQEQKLLADIRSEKGFSMHKIGNLLKLNALMQQRSDTPRI